MLTDDKFVFPRKIELNSKWRLWRMKGWRDCLYWWEHIFLPSKNFSNPTQLACAGGLTLSTCGENDSLENWVLNRNTFYCSALLLLGLSMWSEARSIYINRHKNYSRRISIKLILKPTKYVETSLAFALSGQFSFRFSTKSFFASAFLQWQTKQLIKVGEDNKHVWLIYSLSPWSTLLLEAIWKVKFKFDTLRTSRTPIYNHRNANRTSLPFDQALTQWINA